MDTMALLLGLTPPELPEKEIKIKRLSAVAGKPVIFRLRALPYAKVNEINKLDETTVHIVLAGVVEPNLRDAALCEHYKAVTPAELVKKLLLPGEIEDVARAIESLSGYRGNSIELVEEIKKK